MVSDRSEQFAHRGVPEVVIYDNGPQFVYRDFRDWTLSM